MSYFNLDNCKYDFSSDNINIIALIYDESGSMEGDLESMCTANKAFFRDFSKFEEKGSIAVSKAVFNESFYMTPFSDIKYFNTACRANGGTHLYRAIKLAAENTIDYYNEIVKRLNCRPRITFLVFSDGEDNENNASSFKHAKQALVELNSLDATTVFVAFAEAISSGIGENLGFTCTKNITSVKELIACLGTELSKSCKEQSRSVYSLKSEFFSKATKNSDDDSSDEQAIVDDDFFNV